MSQWTRIKSVLPGSNGGAESLSPNEEGEAMSKTIFSLYLFYMSRLKFLTKVNSYPPIIIGLNGWFRSIRILLDKETREEANTL